MFSIVPPIRESEISEIISIVINILAMIGVVVDPTTKGIGDIDKNDTYYEMNDI